MLTMLAQSIREQLHNIREGKNCKIRSIANATEKSQWNISRIARNEQQSHPYELL